MSQDFPDNNVTNPFADTISDDNFFLDEQREEVANKIAYLTEFSNTVVFLYSEQESGKTSLLKNLTQHKPEWQSCWVYSTRNTEWPVLLKELTDKFDEEHLFPNSDEATLLALLNHISAQQLIPVVIFDNAEQLPLSILVELSRFIDNNDPDQAGLHIILCGRLKHDQIAEHYLKQEELKNLISFISLPSFNAEQSRNYILHRLDAAGLDNKLFNEETLNRIHLQSRGQPSHINALAYSLLTQQPASSESNKEKSSQHKAPTEPSNLGFKLIAASLAISVLLSTIFLGKDHEPSSTDENGDSTIHSRSTEDRVTQELNIPEPEAIPYIPPVEKKTAQEPKVAPLKTEMVEREASSPQPVVAVQKPTVKDDTPVAKPANRLQANHQWIEKQNPQHLTIQLLAASKESALQNFISSHQLGEQAIYYHKLRNGKDWYTLLYGSFETRAQAKLESDNLIRKLNIKSTWIRLMEDVQHDIN